jgi:hypothetical protein
MTTGTESVAPALNGITTGIKGFTDNALKSVPFHDWPYWGYVGYGLGITVILLIVLWFYLFFWRRTSGQVPKEVNVYE